MNKLFFWVSGLLFALAAHAADPLRVVIWSDSPSNAFASGLVRSLNERGAAAAVVSTLDHAALQGARVLVLHSAAFKPRAAAECAAISQFARAGGGLVFLNGAIAAGQADWLKPLVGGAWTPDSRKFSSRMMLYVAPAQHVIVRGSSPFDIDDVTVYDLDLAADIQVMASAFTPKVTGGRRGNRPQSAPNEERANIYDLQPQMWAYEPAPAAGAQPHRAFVLLPGASATLQHASYRTFVLRAVAWTARRSNLDEFSGRDDLAALMYPVGGPSHPDSTVRQFEVHPDFEVSVAAAEPLINKPIAVQWDAKGRLWVAETPEYPNGRRPMVAESWKETSSLLPGKYDRPALDRISILTDPDSGGQFRKKSVFYEGLELVTGFCFYKDGIIAIHNPDIVWIRDTDGDGKGDKVERLYTGFAPGDTHFVANHFIPGPDGWIYASMGGGAEVRNPETRAVLGRVSAGVFRFKPDGSAVEQVSSKGGNGFGLDLTTDFELFFGQATTGNPIQHVVLPEHTLARGKVDNVIGPKSVIEQRKVVVPQLPDRAALRQIDVVGGFSAACSSLIYEGGAWPDEWNRSAFCTEPILNIIHHEKLSPAGPTFTGEKTRDAEFIFSRDYWFRPVDVALGADGALYVVDFYTAVIAHSDTRGPQHGRASASVRPDRDHYFGRIYRVQHRRARKLQVPDLSTADARQLVSALAHPSRVVRFNARSLLFERPVGEVATALRPVAEMANDPAVRTMALWTLSRLGQLRRDTLLTALRAEQPEVRKNAALIVAENRAREFEGEVIAGLKDSDARARLAALRALGSIGLAEASANALIAAIPSYEDGWSLSAAVAAAADQPSVALQASLAAEPSDNLRRFVSAIASRAGEKQDGATLAMLVRAAADAPGNAAMVRVVLDAAAKVSSPPPVSQELTAAIEKLLRSNDAQVSAAALPLAVSWDKSGSLRPQVDAQVNSLLASLGPRAGTNVSPEQRADAAAALAMVRAASPQIDPALLQFLRERQADAAKRRVIAALGGGSDPAAGGLLVGSFKDLSPALQAAAFEVLVTRREWALAFLGAVEAREISLSVLGPANIARLRTHASPDVASRANTVFSALLKPSADKDALIAAFAPAAAKRGNAEKGRELFVANCASCHKFGDLGTQLGPVLTGMGVHGADTLLAHILDPNRRVDSGYESWNIETTDGEMHSGIIARENAASVVLQLAGQQLEIPTSTIKSRVDTRRSLMPEGFEALGEDGLRDLLTFLVGDGSRFRVLDLSSAFTADTRRGLYHSQEALADTLPFTKFGLVEVDGVPFNIVDPAKSILGGNVIVLRGGPRDTFAGNLPRRVEVPVGFAAAKFHFLGGVAGWGGSATPDGPLAMRVTMEFADGRQHQVDLRQGDVFVDYVAPIDAPGSRLAAGVVRGKQVRWFTLPVPHKAAVKKLVLESPATFVAPTTVAITADLSEVPIPGEPVVQLASLRPIVAASAPARRLDVAAPLQWEAGTKVLVVGGGSSHDFRKWFNEADVATIRAAGKYSVHYTESAATAAKALGDADVLVMSANRRGFDTPEFRSAFLKFAESGKGILLLHPAVWYNWPWQEYNKTFVGGGSRAHDAIGEFDVNIIKDHPVTRGLPKRFRIADELYHVNIDPAGAPVEVLASTSAAKVTSKEHPSVWLVKHPHARIVCIAPGHDGRVHELPEYKTLLTNAVKWASRAE